MPTPYGGDVPSSKSSRTLTAEQITYAAEQFLGGRTLCDVETELDIRHGNLYPILRRRGIRTDRSTGRRTLTSDTSCFSDPFTNERAAYFIGLLMADGSISERGGITLAVKETDRDVVDRLNDFLGGLYTVSIVKRTEDGDGWNRSPTARISFQGRQMASELARFGVVHQKLGTEKFLNGIETNRHVWRGMVDGDGSLFFTKPHSYPSIALCGCATILDQFATFVRGICPSWKASVRKTHHSWLKQVGVAGRHAKELAHALYDGATVALERKAVLARRIMAWQPQRVRI